MAELIFLGTSNAIPDEQHENTHMAVVGARHFTMIDCVNNPVVRLQQAGLEIHDLSDLVLTHFHPDHVSGVPQLLMSSWLLGRQKPLRIYGLADTLKRVKKMMSLYEWETWPNFFPVEFYPLSETEMTIVLDNDEYRVLASPVHHLIPTIGLRIEFHGTGKALAYSCDTEPCSEVVRLAKDVDVLIHEAAGPSLGHSSATQAGEIANKAGASQLYLIHYQTGGFDALPLVDEAKQAFQGPVALARDFLALDFQ